MRFLLILFFPQLLLAKPNVLFIAVDDWNDWIGCMGNAQAKTPNVDRLAARGMLFTNASCAASVCNPSRASLLTGCYAQRTGMHRNPRDGQVLRPISPYGLHPEEVTIAEVLREHGYATGIIGKWHLGDQPEFLPLRQGFDRFFWILFPRLCKMRVTRRKWATSSAARADILSTSSPSSG